MIGRIYFASTVLAGLLISGAAYAGNNEATVDQYGYNQQITIDQTGGSFNSVGSAGRSVQQDNGSYSGSNYLNITQTGDHNSFGHEAFSYQSGQENRNTTSQAGTYSSIESVQIGYANGVNSGRGEGYIVQDRSANQSDVNMTSNGSYNVVQVSQGSYDNRMLLNQTGNSNFLSVDQGSQYSGSYNRISATQYGDNNTGLLLQTSDHNTMTLGQTGTSNSANISQTTAWNTATLNQNGTLNAATIRQ